MTTTSTNAALHHFEALCKVAGHLGRYQRDGKEIDGVQAVRGRLTDDGQLVEELVTLDTDAVWLFRRSDLVLDGERITPKPGDHWLVVREGGQIEDFEVLPPSRGERCWRPMDHEAMTIRVFMKLRSTQEETEE